MERLYTVDLFSEKIMDSVATVPVTNVKMHCNLSILVDVQFLKMTAMTNSEGTEIPEIRR